MNISNIHTLDVKIPTQRLQLDKGSNSWVEAPHKIRFLRGPIQLAWLEQAAALPGKSLHVAMALCWVQGMNNGKSFKLTQKSLDYFHVSRDAATDGLQRLEQVGLIKVERKPGQRPIIEVIGA